MQFSLANFSGKPAKLLEQVREKIRLALQPPHRAGLYERWMGPDTIFLKIFVSNPIFLLSCPTRKIRLEAGQAIYIFWILLTKSPK